MFFKMFSSRKKQAPKIQYEYVELLKTVMSSPLWDSSDEQIYRSFPGDLNAETIEYVKRERNAS